MTKSPRQKAWEAISKYCRYRHPVCQVCNKKSSTQVHHIISKTRGNSIYLCLSNLLAVCWGCHVNWHNGRISQFEKNDIIKRELGEKYNNAEDIKNTIIKLYKKDYEDIEKEYKEKLEELENE